MLSSWSFKYSSSYVGTFSITYDNISIEQTTTYPLFNALLFLSSESHSRLHDSPCYAQFQHSGNLSPTLPGMKLL